MVSIRREKVNAALLRHHHKSLSQDKELDAIRAIFIYEEQRIPNDEEQRVRPLDLARLGPLLPALLGHLEWKTSRSAFRLNQRLWTHLAGEWSRYWRLEDGGQREPDKPLYASLDAAKREIRVLQVSRLSPVVGNTRLDDNRNGAFQANLMHVSLDDDPPYIAVSYAWGDHAPVGRFKSDQEGAANFEYNRAVFEIVNTLVPEGSTLYLWIDAVCINQQDDAEKGIQVGLMGEIFRKSRQVVIFLGEADEDTTTNMDLISRAIPIIEEDFPEWATEEDVARFEAESTKAGIPPRAWCSVHALALRRWFTRYWVVQELALGKAPVVVCGRHSVPWDLVADVYDWISDHWSLVIALFDRIRTYEGPPYRTPPLAQDWLNVYRLIRVRRMSESQRPLSIQQLVNHLDIFDATDPRDRIFAITGLVSPAEVEEDFRPNYEIRVEELYTQVARRFLIGHNGLHNLYMAGVGLPRSLCLPSWVPDWTLKRELLRLYRVATKKGLHSAGNIDFRVEFPSDSSQVAILHGCIVDSVWRLGPVNDAPYRPVLENSEAESRWFNSVLELITSCISAIDFSTACRDSPLDSPQWKYCLWETLIASESTEIFAERVFDSYVEYMGCSARSEPWEHLDSEVGHRVTDLRISARAATFGRRVFVSSKGYFGLTSSGTQEGDQVCVFAGMITPIIIRPVKPEAPDSPSTPTSYILVGEAYHHGIAEQELDFEPQFMGPIRLV
ncbi:hypothetical protein VSDG_01564 [Cytospora chrysosperma]|uniref:Heterokaryon incompatibility domain-containing protein n=1 Tax=Cytospora chrysosperma TaxID=252740 RepID=A0A423WIS6_CYTCH|nr:hypothetical protein VSDG_01564 [Valsa sordida]